MLIGIMSDTHGRHLAARAAMELFQRLGAGHVFHCGDVGGIAVFDELLSVPCTFVWGNTDEPDQSTFAYLEGVGLPLPSKPPARMTLDGKTFAVFHGHERAFSSAVSAGGIDYLLHGHTHEARDERIGGVRIINPGALQRARIKTVATLDTKSEELTFYEIEA